jgi:hypothetical protein
MQYTSMKISPPGADLIEIGRGGRCVEVAGCAVVNGAASTRTY